MILSFLFIVCCKSKQAIIQNKVSKNVKLNYSCVLSELPKTTNYTNEIPELADIYRDTVIKIESAKSNGFIYKSIFELRPSSHFLWLIKESMEKKDSILIQAFSNTKSVQTYFDTERCELENVVVEFHANGDPKVEYSKFISLSK